MVAGNVAQGFLNNVAKHCFQAVENINRSHSDHSHALADQPGVAQPIPLRAITIVMRVSIDLNDQLSCGTKEIQHIDTRRMLATEPQASRTLPQLLP